MDVAEWQRRLEKNFSIDGIVGKNLLRINEQEKRFHKFYVSKYQGQVIIIDSFQGFFIETIQNAFKWIMNHGWPKGCKNYSPILLYYIVLFRGFRACENLLLRGYPFDGYALLRTLKDRTIFLAGIAHNITTLPSILF